jgi:arylformamidase
MSAQDQTDWDDSYANAAYIPGADDYPVRWQAESAALLTRFRHDTLRYGAHPRMEMDLVFPEGDPEGLVVFVHGGYWLRFDRTYWTFLAEGALARGYGVAMPSYPLCPQVTIPEITVAVARAVQLAADAVPGPVRLAGHSAGGHLAARMLCADVDLPCRDRIRRALAISPVSDLREMQKTAMAGPLRLDDASATLESPVLHPAPATPFTVWVGADERPVFLDQARWLGQAWDCPVEVEAGKHHFDVIDGLADPDHPMCKALFS